MAKAGETKRTAEWERARVRRWLEITLSDPMSPRPGSAGGTSGKYMAEFEERYAQLEADVPTP